MWIEHILLQALVHLCVLSHFVPTLGLLFRHQTTYSRGDSRNEAVIVLICSILTPSFFSNRSSGIPVTEQVPLSGTLEVPAIVLWKGDALDLGAQELDLCVTVIRVTSGELWCFLGLLAAGEEQSQEILVSLSLPARQGMLLVLRNMHLGAGDRAVSTHLSRGSENELASPASSLSSVCTE